MLQELETQPVQTNMTMCEGLFVKHCVFDAGSWIPQHSHSTEHLSVIAAGAVRVWQDGVELGEFHAPAGITIKAHCKHTFLALEPNTTILCVHRVEDGEEPDIHEESDLEEAARCHSAQ